MSKNIRLFFSRGTVSVLIFLTVFGAVPLGTAPANAAEEILVNCEARTQEGAAGYVAADSTSCTVPSGASVSRLNLDYILDDGGEISINNSVVFGLPPDYVVDSGNRDVSYGLSGGQRFTLKVEARNAVGDDGDPVGPVYGRATLQVWGTRVTAPPPPPPPPLRPPLPLPPPPLLRRAIPPRWSPSTPPAFPSPLPL